MHSDYVFIKTLGPGASARDRELRDQNARSHAALVSHSRSKIRRQNALGKSKALTVQPFLAPSFPEGEPPADLIAGQSQSGHSAKYRITTLSQQAQHSPSTSADSSSLCPCDDADFGPVQLLRCAQEGVEDGSEVRVLHHPPATVIEDTVTRVLKSQPEPVKVYRDINPIYTQLYNGPSSNTPSFAKALAYYFGNDLPNNFAVYKIFDVARHHSQILFDLLAETHFRHAWVAQSLAVKSKLWPNSAMKEQAWRYGGIALDQVRRSIADREYLINGALIVSVMFLGWTARVAGQIDEAETHQKFLAVLVQRSGGLDNLGFDGIKAYLLQWESFWAIDRGYSVFAKERHTRPPVYPWEPYSASLRETINRFPVGFNCMASAGILPLDVIDILSQITRYLQPSEREHLFKEVNVILQPRKHIDFWEACSSLAIPDIDFNKCLCLTLLLYTALEFSPIRLTLRVMYIFTIPRDSLLRQIHLLGDHISDPSQRECWIWMYMVLLNAWSENGELSPSAGKVLLTQFLESFPELRSWNSLEAVLRRFFWTEKFKHSCHSSWDALLLARGARDTRAATHLTTAPDSRLD